jgi:hypothetical protein
VSAAITIGQEIVAARFLGFAKPALESVTLPLFSYVAASVVVSVPPVRVTFALNHAYFTAAASVSVTVAGVVNVA